MCLHFERQGQRTLRFHQNRIELSVSYRAKNKISTFYAVVVLNLHMRIIWCFTFCKFSVYLKKIFRTEDPPMSFLVPSLITAAWSPPCFLLQTPAASSWENVLVSMSASLCCLLGG